MCTCPTAGGALTRKATTMATFEEAYGPQHEVIGPTKAARSDARPESGQTPRGTQVSIPSPPGQRS